MPPAYSAIRVKTAPAGQHLPFLAAVSVLVFLFSWIIRKDVQMPSAVLLAFAGVGLLTLVLLGLQQPELFLYALAVYLPFNRVLVGDFGTNWTALNLTNILMALATLGWFIRASNRREGLFRPTALNGWLLLFILLGLVSVYRGSQLWFGTMFDMNILTRMKRWFTPMWLFFIGANLVNNRTTLSRLLTVVSLVVTVIALMAIRDYSYVSGLELEKARVEGVMGQSNSLGAFFSYYMFLMAGILLHYASRWNAWLLLGPLAACFRGIMVTFSRGAYLSFAAGLLGLCFFRSKKLFALLLVAIAFAFANPWMLPSGIRFRFTQTIRDPSQAQFEESLDGSARSRLQIWRGGLQMVSDYPWLGVGFGLFPLIAPRYAAMERNMDAHNTYLLVAGEMGIPALIVFVIILGLILLNAAWLERRSRDPLVRSLGLGMASGTCALLASNMFGSRMNAPDLISYFWLLAGVVVGAKVLVKRGVLS